MTVLYIFKEEDASDVNPILRLHDGYHYVGREAPVNCNDKRISRKHAIIVVHRNGAIIKSAHVNPTFFKSSVNSAIQILRENDTLALNNGDRFALVEDAVWFKVQIRYENVDLGVTNDISFNAISNKRVHEEDSIEIQKRIKIEIENVQDRNEEAVNTSTLNIHTSNSVNMPPNVENINNNIEGPDPLPSSRPYLDVTLPDNPDVNIDRPDLDATLPDNPDVNIDRSDLDATLPGNPVKIETPNSNVTLPNNPSTTLQIPESTNGQNVNLTNTSSNIYNIKIEPLENTDFNVGITVTPNPINSQIKVEPEVDIKEEPPENVENDPNTPSSSTNNNPTANTNLRRDRCWYGKQCYRKNPAHKEAFTHPGDTDYDSDPNDSRPVCPYGVHCYRKNIAHRREYRHFGRPAPRPRNVNIHVHVNNCPFCNNLHQKPDYESDYESDPDY